MTVKELKKLLKNLPNDMDVFIELPEAVVITACFLKSGAEEIHVPVEGAEDIDPEELEDEDLETMTVFILRPCGCEDEIEEGEINSQPQLN